jgi:6-hydroxymethylpterin diphosphokinase MptE-like protein
MNDERSPDPLVVPDKDEQCLTTSGPMQVLEGLTMSGRLNTERTIIASHIEAAIRRGHPQVRGEPLKPERVALVASGPSLRDTIDELREAVFDGAKVVTVNGAYHWAIAHNFRPSAQIVLDARESTARFLDPPVARCKYLLASQCHPATWDAVDGRPDVWIWHAVDRDSPHAAILDQYYTHADFWQPIIGGTTVGVRAILLLRSLGYVRFDVFGMDSCYLGDAHHAFDQPENAAERRYRVKTHPSGRDDLVQQFDCAPWHIKQIEDFMQMIRVFGDQVLLNIHGRGVLAHILQTDAAIVVEQEEEA